MAAPLIRNYRVKGNIECEFNPPSGIITSTYPNIEIQLWCKAPFEIIKLGTGTTDVDGDFVIDFQIDSPNEIITDGEIKDVFIKALFNDVIVSEDVANNITINEGYTDIGSLNLDITDTEIPITEQPITIGTNPENQETGILFYFMFDGKPLSSDYDLTFTIPSTIADDEMEVVLHTSPSGYVKLPTPLYPIVTLDPDKTIFYSVKGPLENRANECYLRLESSKYTLITEFVINGDKLKVFNGIDTYYNVVPTIPIDPAISAIRITTEGKVYGYTTDGDTWIYLDQLSFTMFEFPDELNVVSDGFYSLSGSEGTITNGTLSASGTAFEAYSGVVLNPEPYLIDVDLEISTPDTTPETYNFTNLKQGSLNAKVVDYTGEEYEPSDMSPPVGAIEAVSGITFTTGFATFLSAKKLDNLNDVRKAGPIKYVAGYNASGATETETNILQAHTDFYFINQDIEQNQLIIDAEYMNIYDVANTPKNVFIDDVAGEDISIFEAAKIHETAVQNQKLVGNLLADLLSDMRLDNPVIPEVEDSGFVSKVLSKAVNPCGCDDCKSNISPFAYLMELIKYAAARVDYIGSPAYSHGVDTVEDFITLISDKFLQPFGTMNVDCHTLHDEYCRVRLVTEVLEKWVDIETLAGHINATKLANLSAERNQYLLLVYRSILLQAGTSYEELRTVVTSPADKKQEAATKLCDRLGIPFYVPSTLILTVDTMWLTLENADPAHELNAENLEAIFGFRDTQRDVITNTPVWFMQEWHEAYLRDIWKSQDYPLSDYTREGIIPSNNATFKSNWKPIIDPDQIGHADFTYLSDTDMPKSIFTRALYVHRKEDTDDFLSYCLNDSINISRTSADLLNRIVKAQDVDLTTQTIEDNQIQLQEPDSPNDWITFDIFNKKLVGTNTDVILTKPLPVIFQPNGTSPKMRYKQVLNVTSLTGTSSIEITWTDPVIMNALSGGYAKLESDGVGANPPFTTDAGSSAQLIASVDFDNDHQVTVHLAVGATPPNSAFLAGNIKFVYEVEVPLFNDVIIDPEKIATNLFDETLEYELLTTAAPGMTDPFEYTVWERPSSWPSPINSSFTDFGKLKQLYNILLSGSPTDALLALITDNLRMNRNSFTRMMQLLLNCENYLLSMYTAKLPATQDLYELASIFRSSAKTLLQPIWVKEEAKYEGPAGSEPSYNLMLSGQYFWKSISEPATGSWDPSLQTIPEIVGDITSYNVPIIDPELLLKKDMLVGPDTDIYHNLYDSRKEYLEDTYQEYIDRIPGNDIAFVEMLNVINTGDTDTPFDISPYSTLAELSDDLNSNDAFRVKEASDVLWEAFRLNKEDFNVYNTIKNNYENENPLVTPSNADIIKAVKLFVSAFKRKQLYTEGLFDGWINEEIEGTFPDGVPVKYYNVLNMKLAPGRSNSSDRTQWQKTLADWNRKPTIQPDIVPPENIREINSSNWIYTTWTDRHTDLLDSAGDISGVFNATLDADVLFDNLKVLINLSVARLPFDFGTLPQIYVPYFIEIAEKENNDEDIRPYLNQLGITVEEYRFLWKVYTLLESETPSAPSSLLTSEYEDVTNILIAINSRNITFDQVLEEYDNDVILDQDYFKLFEPAPINFPLTDLPLYNKWRSPFTERKKWINTLETRIDQQTSIDAKWEEVLLEAEDKNMPLLRDALIRALTANCEDWQVAAERLAKSFFIETKDNCCVKHTRVSFAIETLHGLLFALQSGVYDDYAEDFVLIAPEFRREWEWIGSYNTWRSAMFVFLFPENILYPTLKRIQSEGFVSLSTTLSNSNKLSPNAACEIAHDYESYFNDIANIEIVCSTNVSAVYNKSIPNLCCEEETETKKVTYYIGQGTSGRSYYSIFDTTLSVQEGLDTWISLPIPKNVTVLACVPNIDTDDDGNEIGRSLMLYYSYYDKNELQLRYIKKVISKSNNDWSGEQEIELPDNSFGMLEGIIVSQQNLQFVNLPSFVFNYFNLSTGDRTVVYYEFDEKLSKFIREFICEAGSLVNYSRLQFSLKTRVSISNINGNFRAVALCTTNAIKFRIIGVNNSQTNLIDSDLHFNNNILGIFTIAGEQNAFIVVVGTLYTIEWKKIVISVSYNSASAICSASITNVVNSNGILGATKMVYPSFGENENDTLNFAISSVSLNSVIGGAISVSGSGPFNTVLSNPFDLKPVLVNNVPIQSADCISNMYDRITNIKSNILFNKNSPSGTSSYTVIRSNSVRELLYEAYYYVPMLIALDQQKRGQFESALAWYKSVYDYTNPISTGRKIFYGLVLEQSITSTFTQAADWLLDPLNPHLVAQTRVNAYTKYTVMNIIQCLYDYADRLFTLDTIETVPTARKLYTTALELLQISEIKIITNLCLSTAYDCLDSQAEMSNQRKWSNLYDELKQKLSTIGDADTIESITGSIATLLNSADEETFPDKFAEAFELIDTNMPEPPATEDVEEVMSGLKTRINDAFRYLSAIYDPTDFNEFVGEKYTTAVARISGLTNTEVQPATEQIAWLQEAVPSNSTPMEFRFINEEGQQLLPDPGLQYDPLQPRPNTYVANHSYVNAPIYIAAYNYQVGMPAEYTPLADYAFCMPKNPVYDALILKGNLELYKIFNCRNIAGVTRELSAYSAATDAVSGIPVIGANGTLQLPSLGNFVPSQYRFRVLIERAKEIAAQAQQMESLFLAALEKEDAARYDLLRAKQDLETSKATVRLQDLRINQARDEQGVANLQLNKVTFIQSHYNDLIAAGYLDFERRSLDNLQFAEVMQYISAGLSAVAAGFSFSSVAVTVNPREILAALGSGFSSLALASSSVAGALSTQASILSTIASYQRREQEWQFQSQLAGLDISLANQQIKIAEDGVRIATQEREIAVLNTSHAESTLEFLKNKFTNAELYNFMGTVLERSYSYMLNLSTAIARSAESQLYFERQELAGPFVLDDYWEAPSNGINGSGTSDRRGLTGSARLLVDITRLDQFAFETAKRKLQMTKVISLAQNFPSEFQQFRETGIMNFELTNNLFDYDFPGHYLRLINSVKTTVVGLLPVYDQIKATLTADTTSYTVIGGTTFQKIPIRRAELDTVALTAANNATGLFELQPAQNEFLNPFEGMGIESRWEFKMPKFSNRLDYSNIADILVTVEYTALDSYQYRYQVLQDLQNEITFNRGFSFKNNFPDQWFELGEAEAGTNDFGVTIQLKREMFPQGIENLQLNLFERIVLYFVREDGFTSEIEVADFSKADPSSNSTSGGTTVNGILESEQLMTSIGESPLVSLRLSFENNITNRELFSESKVTDILLLVPCKGELSTYPL